MCAKGTAHFLTSPKIPDAKGIFVMIQFTPVGDSGVLAVCGSEISEQVNAQVMALDAAVQAIDSQKLAEAAQQILQPLLDAVEAASSFEDALARIEQAFPQVPVDKLQGMLADAMFSASMSGRVNGERS